MYFAREVALDRQVALQVLPRERGADAGGELVREISWALAHAHEVVLIARGLDRGTLTTPL